MSHSCLCQINTSILMPSLLWPQPAKAEMLPRAASPGNSSRSGRQQPDMPHRRCSSSATAHGQATRRHGLCQRARHNSPLHWARQPSPDEPILETLPAPAALRGAGQRTAHGLCTLCALLPAQKAAPAKHSSLFRASPAFTELSGGRRRSRAAPGRGQPVPSDGRS